LYINEIEIEGIGNLHIEFNRLKEKLNKEGLFDPKYKIPIPKMPNSIGVITSPTGAVIRDIINVIKRRYPKVNIKLYPVMVQGDKSAEEIFETIRFFNHMKNVDTLIVGRGGGTIEELWSFNDEMVAREVFNSQIPIISAVGHETDFT
ncbi:exodeoxyribonuclease VII large subunit, partial [Acinetobacter baumannii]|nr:exodeoxyribonuclease VII large subunit [Acinetobacter baumannii]